MDSQEANMQSVRADNFRRLEKERDDIYGVIRALTEDDKNGPCGQGPFTSNMRESRQVKSINVNFTTTRGGAPAVVVFLPGLGIEAHEFARYLEKELRAKLAVINKAMSQI